MKKFSSVLRLVTVVFWSFAFALFAICAYGADTPSRDASDYDLRILSVVTSRYLKRQYVEGGQRVGMMVRGGKLITERVKPKNGVFVLVEIEALYSGLGAAPDESSGEKDPWKAAARAFARYKDVKPLVCDTKSTILMDGSGLRYAMRGRLRVEDEDYFVGLVAQDKNTASDILGLKQHGPGKFWLYFDVTKNATSLEIIPSAGFPAMALPAVKDKQLEDFRRIFPGIVGATLDEVKAELEANPRLAGTKSTQGFPPLYVVADWGYTEMVEVLLASGADPNIADKDGETPLHRAAVHGNSDVVDLLLTSGTRSDVGDTDGTTPLHFAVIYGHEEVAHSLLQKGTNVNAQNKQGNTPLHDVTGRANIGLTELLLKFGAYPNIKAENGATPLHNAASVGSKEIVRLLVKYKANVNAKATTGDTPLHCAVGLVDEKLSKDVAEVLLDAGADPSIKAGDGKSPLDVAIELKHDEVARLLRTKGLQKKVTDSE